MVSSTEPSDSLTQLMEGYDRQQQLDRENARRAFDYCQYFYRPDAINYWVNSTPSLLAGLTSYNLGGEGDTDRFLPPRTVPRFQAPQSLVWRCIGNPARVHDDFSRRALAFGETTSEERHDCPKENPGCVLQKDRLEQWATAWNRSPICDMIVNHIKSKAAVMERVDMIVCFELGKLELSNKQDESFNDQLNRITSHPNTPYAPPHPAKNYLHHAAAIMIKTTLEAVQKTGAIPIYAQDLAYCNPCKAMLKEKGFIFIIAEYNQGYLLLDRHTFVITFSPRDPVHFAATQLLASVGGPAGMFCSHIDEHDDGLHRPSLDEYDLQSPALLEYRRRNLDSQLEFNDAENPQVDGNDGKKVFGNVGIYLKKCRE